MGKGDPQTHSQLMNPFTHDQSWRERIRTEQKRAKGFWAQHSVETVEKLGMDYTQRRPESLIPKHAYADSSASSVVSHGTNGTAMSSKVSGYTMSRGGTGVGSETTQVRYPTTEKEICRSLSSAYKVGSQVVSHRWVYTCCFLWMPTMTH